MKAIHAIWKNGQIVLTQPVDWPEGTALAVEPIEESLVTDPERDLLGDDPASIARWLAWFDIGSRRLIGPPDSSDSPDLVAVTFTQP